MSKPIIEVNNLSKKYRLGEFSARSLREEAEFLWERVRHQFRSRSTANGDSSSPLAPKVSEKDFWALKNVSFTVHPGEVVGIIGRNGAGKSTLLKILSRITEPTDGEVIMRGRVASLLEVGTGFHPELSGRDNIYLNGAILGMKSGEITRKLDEIVAFAEIEKFLDTPVKRYSSGMYVRLAFAVAAHLDPEILIVDEVLAVGDQQFQTKCMDKMKNVSASGRTILFVSHNIGAVRNLCSSALLMKNGVQVFRGPAEIGITKYLSVSESSGGSAQMVYTGALQRGGLRLLTLEVKQDKQTRSRLTVSGDFDVLMKFEALDVEHIAFPNIHVFTTDGQAVFSSVAWPEINSTPEEFEVKPLGTGTYLARCRVTAGSLNEGDFYISALFINNASEVMENHERLIEITLVDDGRDRARGFTGKWLGTSRPVLSWKLARADVS